MTKDIKSINLRLPAQLVRKLDAAAKAENRSRNTLVVLRLADSLSKKKSQGAIA